MEQYEVQCLVEQSAQQATCLCLYIYPRPADLSAVGRKNGAGSTRVFNNRNELKDGH